MALLATFAGQALAQLPTARLDSIFPAGGKAGGEVSVKVRGADLDDADRLQFSHAGITAAPKPVEGEQKKDAKKPTGEAEFIVKIAGDVPPGVYEARVVGRFGMSNPRLLAVGTLDEVAKAEGNNQRKSAMEIGVPTVVNAAINKETVDYYKIYAKAGGRITFDCQAQRIDSKMDATLALYDSQGKELLLVRDSQGLDPVLSATIPSDGEYTLAVYDFTYEGGSDYFYRLTAHAGPSVAFVFPPVAEAGKPTKVTAYGTNLAGGQPAEGMPMDDGEMQQVAVDVAMPADDASRQTLDLAATMPPRSAGVDGGVVRIDSPAGSCGAMQVAYATAPVVIETEPNDEPAKAQSIQTPCEYVGRFFPRGDRDWVTFDAKKGDALWIEVISHQMGAIADPMLVIQQVTKNEQGEETVKQLAEVDDPADAAKSNADVFSVVSKDPSHRFEAPEDGTYRVQVYDLYDNPNNDPRAAYRLAIRPIEPDFRLLAFAPAGGDKNKVDISSTVLRRGGSEAVSLTVIRRDGFDGEIDVAAEELPAGVSCPAVTIPAGATSAALVLVADENAAAWAGPLKIVGRANVDGKELVRPARGGSLVWGSPNAQSEMPVARLTQDLGLAVIAEESSPASVTLGDGNMIDIKLGEKAEVPVKVVRRGEFKEALKLAVVGLPAEIKAPEVNVAGEEGKLMLDLTNAKMREGVYTVYLQGTAKMKYTRPGEDKPKDVNIQVLSTPIRIRVLAKG